MSIDHQILVATAARALFGLQLERGAHFVDDLIDGDLLVAENVDILFNKLLLVRIHKQDRSAA